MIRFKKDDGSNYPDIVEDKMQNLSKINQGLQIAIENRFDKPGDGRYFYITNEFLKEGANKRYYIENPPKSVICTKEDILMTRTGNTGLVVSNVDGCFHNNFFKIDYDRARLNKDYLLNFFKRPETLHRILVLAGASTILDLNHKDFYSIKIPVPCLEEQQKIADFLSSVDDVITESEKEVAALEEQKKGVMQKIFSQEVRFKADDGSDYPEWEEELLGDLSELYTGKSFSNDLADDGKYIVMDMGTVASNGFRIESKHTNLLRDILEKDDLVMPKDDIGGGLIICKTVHIPENNKYVLGDHVYRLHFSGQNGMFMHYLINSEKINRSFKRKVTGSAQLGIKSQNVTNQLLPIPCLEEQEKIANFLSDFDKAIDLAKQELEQWKELKKGLLQQLFE